MADHRERIAKARRNVQEWAEKEEHAVDEVQKARRMLEKGRTTEEAVKVLEQHLRAVRARKDRHEDILRALREEWADMSHLDQAEELWRDAVQDAERGVTRIGKTLRRLRREEKADREAAIEETHAHDGTVDAHEELVFTRKQLTEAEEAYQKQVGLLHNAEAALSKTRRKQAEAAHGDGTRETIIWRALESMDHHRARYSQAGRWSVKYWREGEPNGYRTDCSQWSTSVYWAAGAKDPNGNDYNGGYTGTQSRHGRAISRGAVLPADMTFFGTGDFHHVELNVFPHPVLSNKLNDELRRRGFGRDDTIGHGSPPVDKGSIDMLSGPKAFRTFF